MQQNLIGCQLKESLYHFLKMFLSNAKNTHEVDETNVNDNLLHILHHENIPTSFRPP